MIVETPVRVRAFDGLCWVDFGDFRDIDHARSVLRVIVDARRTASGLPHWTLAEAVDMPSGDTIEQWVWSRDGMGVVR